MIVIFLSFLVGINAITKVLVPSTWKEFEGISPENMPPWMQANGRNTSYDFETFAYQKLDKTKPNFIAFNRGAEAGVYLRYVVDHYDNFPDIAIFTHSHPEHHHPYWLELIDCIKPDVDYLTLNGHDVNCRTTHNWPNFEFYVEQCWRDLLKIAWEMEDKQAEFNKIVPVTGPVSVCINCCQQFFMSRKQVHKRSLAVWKKLLFTAGENNVCHEGPLDLENLYVYHTTHRKMPPETPTIVPGGPNTGTFTQGWGMEYLAHVIFGHQPLIMNATHHQATYCSNFQDRCQADCNTKWKHYKEVPGVHRRCF